MRNDCRFLALYLPQYHPTEENDRWYGKGFTEWTNVTKAKQLFHNHYQPHVPADLGFYDLRLPSVRREQADMAKAYGISGFCHWCYWFGDGKQMLQQPIWDMFQDKEYKFPFCLGWANHTWQNKLWDSSQNNQILIEQKYLGEEDYKAFFYNYLPIFKDPRYFKVNGKLFFIVYQPLESLQLKKFIEIWQELACKEDLPAFYFVAHDFNCRSKKEIFLYGYDAIYDDNTLAIHHYQSIVVKVSQYIKRNVFHMPTVFNYKKAIKYMIRQDDYQENIIPVIAPNWDHSPRTGKKALIYTKCEPKYFKYLVKESLECIKNKPEDKKIIIIKSWNEWGEGNHMEPDLKYGRGYLEALKEAIEEAN